MVVMALKPRIADWPIALQLAIYVALIVSRLSTLFLARLRAADPGGAAELREGAARRLKRRRFARVACRVSPYPGFLP